MRGANRTSFRSGVVLGGAAALAVPGVAGAATFTVNSNVGAGPDGTCGTTTAGCTLADAIDRANATEAADTIVFASSVTGSIELTANLPTIEHATTISGPGADVLRIDAKGERRIFSIYADGIYGDGPVLIEGLTLYDGETLGTGGAVKSYQSDTTLRGVVINQSRSTGGGGVYSFGGELQVFGSLITNNAATGAGFGGGIMAISGLLDIQNSTVSGNSASTAGAGIFAYSGVSPDPLAVESSTVVFNTSFGDGGGIALNQANLNLNNTIVANNTAAGLGDDLHSGDDPGDTFLATYSLIEDPADADVSSISGNIFSQDPGLRPLADAGGPTASFGLDTSSPAYEAGSTALGHDQRGAPRPGGGGNDDIGAVELDLLPPQLTLDRFRYTTDPTPSLTFSSPSSDVDYFLCSLDSAPAVVCESPYTAGTLDEGEHTLRVSAVDFARNLVSESATFVVDTAVSRPKSSAKKKQRQRGGKIILKIKAGAGEDVEGKAKGTISVRGGKGRGSAAAKKFRLKPATGSSLAGKQATYRLKPKKKKDDEKLVKLLRKGKKLRANSKIRLQDRAGNRARESHVVKLVAGKR